MEYGSVLEKQKYEELMVYQYRREVRNHKKRQNKKKRKVIKCIIKLNRQYTKLVNEKAVRIQSFFRGFISRKNTEPVQFIQIFLNYLRKKIDTNCREASLISKLSLFEAIDTTTEPVTIIQKAFKSYIIKTEILQAKRLDKLKEESELHLSNVIATKFKSLMSKEAVESVRLDTEIMNKNKKAVNTISNFYYRCIQKKKKLCLTIDNLQIFALSKTVSVDTRKKYKPATSYCRQTSVSNNRAMLTNRRVFKTPITRPKFRSITPLN